MEKSAAGKLVNFGSSCKCLNFEKEHLRRNPIENRAISGFSGQKSVPEQF